MGKRKYLVVTVLLAVLWTSKVGVMQGEVEQPVLADVNTSSSTALSNQNPVSTSVAETRTITAYSCTDVLCGPSPLTTASGQRVRDGIVAANWLPFGTKIKIPEIFGDKVFVVEDRTAPRYGNRVDIWLPSTQEALQFGIHRTTVEILD